MAVVESAADGFTLTLPTLGLLTMPPNFVHLVADPNVSPSLQFQHEHDRFLLHHHQHYQLNHHLFHQQNLQKSLHLAVDQAAAPQHVAIGRSESEIVKLINAEPLILLRDQSITDGGKVLADGSNENENTTNAQPLGETKSSSVANGSPLPGSSTNADPSKQSSVDNMRELEDLLSKLNPLAAEFVPSGFHVSDAALSADRKKKNDNMQGKRKANGRISKEQREECIRRTVYVSDIDQQVTEEQLAALFLTCGPVVDCRVCGDPNSVLRFAFVEFTNESGARAALNLAGTMLGYYPVRVLPSKTAILPVNPTFLPRTEDEREMCARTIYCTNIDKKVQQADVKLFFESLCGEVARLRLLGDYRHSTRIAFVEFVRAESAMAALNCSGAILGSLPLRVSPSKTPVRPRSPRLLY